MTEEKCIGCGNHAEINDEHLCGVCENMGLKGSSNPEPEAPAVPKKSNKIRQKIFNIAVPDPENRTQNLVAEECQNMARFLLEKNRRYGNSVLDPVRLFSDADPLVQIEVRIDDKLSRMKQQKRSGDDDEDTLKDLIGYLILYRVARRTLDDS